MTAPLPRTMTPEEYLAFERSSEGKHEYVDGYVCAMSGARRAHVALEINLIVALRGRLRPGCSMFTSNMRVRSGDAQPYFYPDLSALCGTPSFADGEFDVLLDPSVIVEILSESTEAYDRWRKFAMYRKIPTLREYVLVAQDRIHAERYTRADAEWARRDLDGPDAVLELASVGVALRLGDRYERVEFPPHLARPRRVRERPAAGVPIPHAPEAHL